MATIVAADRLPKLAGAGLNGELAALLAVETAASEVNAQMEELASRGSP